jgi:hypothetical protein
MAQWCEMKAYSMENGLSAPAPSPEVSHSGSWSPEKEITASRLSAPTVGAVIRRWNWKSALLSSLFRATIFFFTNLIAGWHAAFGAMLAELALRSVTSGFYGAITESFALARPAWAATAAAVLTMPFLAHSLEFVVHWLRGTPKLGLSIGTSVIFTALSTAFNLYAMRRGILVTSGNGKSLRDDLSHIPQLLLAFVLAGPREIVRRFDHETFPR